MYSKNDYRYYLEYRLAESDDYLAHYGVKGMKWKKHVANQVDTYLAGKARKLGYGGTYFARDNQGGLVEIKKNNKDLAYNYLNDRGYHAKKAVDKKIKRIKNKKLRKLARKASNATYKTYNKQIVNRAEKRGYDSHNLEVRDGWQVAVKKGKKAK